MKVKVVVSKSEFNKIGLDEEELQFAISKMLDSSYDCDDGGLLLGLGVEQHEVDLEII